MTEHCGDAACEPGCSAKKITGLQAFTLVWMLAECGVSLWSAARAHSPALLAFGADSLVELFSAVVVLMQFVRWFPLSEDRAARIAGALLYALAAVVAALALAALAMGMQPEVSLPGMAITVAALLAMPLLAWQKRRLARKSGNVALAADAVQSATCAYLAAITLAGLAVNFIWHVGWIDSAAALAAVPLILQEARRAMRGESCGCGV
ncbi:MULTISPECIES: cation transporter [Acidobacterium]|uniref:Putative membrane protein n=1 Tax=Acidobacterium capsulatum (strain ATCC 51196 / DSM 11244 / BCRC 80197 / JCM 7670 / NBRC 15755 / NCIMB 13165 / 161) TaxID=240015 RepID=C1F8D9_ACIC5|nr:MULTISPECIES: cation transporter [Acidobacterium]ACO34250.1 putative membrane protein [Acidobacterium capsulatum ATCC 51196]HCT59823.1 cation transporter [Acidobacterium sp.]